VNCLPLKSIQKATLRLVPVGHSVKAGLPCEPKKSVYLGRFRYNRAGFLRAVSARRPRDAPCEVRRLSGMNRLREIRAGFEPAFWIANVTELFERLSYYGQSAVLAIFLHESLRLSAQQTGSLMGAFGFAVWFLPVLGGSLADRFGFRNSLLFAYLILTLGYFLMGSLASAWMAPLRDRLPLYWLVFAVLMVPALGPSLVKPTVAGTTARASSEVVRSIGYSIYYTLVNVGGMLGPIVAYFVRNSLGIENVFRVSAVFVFAMFWVTLLFYREPSRPDETPAARMMAPILWSVAIGSNLRCHCDPRALAPGAKRSRMKVRSGCCDWIEPQVVPSPRSRGEG